MLERNHLTVLTLSIRPRAQPEDDMGDVSFAPKRIGRRTLETWRENLLHFRGR